MSDVIDDPLCERVELAMSELLDGSAPEELLDHVAVCDRCRDARHDAERLAELVAASGSDYRHPVDFEARVLAALDRAPNTEPAIAPVTTKAAPLSKPDPGAMPRRAPRRSALAWLRRPRNTALAGVLGAALAAAVVALWMRPGDPASEAGRDAAPWTGKVARISRAAGGEGGLEVCDAAGAACRPLAADGVIEPGALLRTDDRTRAYLELGDGTKMALDRSTELSFDAERDRRCRLARGALVAEVAKVEGSDGRKTTARIELPRGHVEVLGTKLAVRAMGEAVAVDVTRGAVLLVDESERSVEVRAGEEGRSYPGVPPYATAAPRLGEALSWSETAEEEEAIAVRGLGELKAKKPGETNERQGAVRLTAHRVKTRIVDGFARTEVEEVFTNTTDEVLEGIFRFPLPPDAQIESLALEVDGKLEQGAFVDRDRAAAIWRGAIVNSGGQRQERQEIIWVPGPWKDPALLEWQRGGRFELRIFPIPKQGSRRVVLTYTQVIKPVGGVRRYVYPLAHDASGDLRVDEFTADIQLRGHDRELGVSTQGYTLSRASSGGADTLSMSERSFVPNGDLVVEYAMGDRESELTAWAYQSTASTTVSPAPAVANQLPAVALSTRSTVDDTATPPAPEAPFVALALRPKLPPRTDDVQRAYVLVIDASRSMYGERYRRATQLATRVVAELDRLDRVTVLACDTMCRELPGGLTAPGYDAASRVKQFLEGITPEGASDPAANVREAAAAAGPADGRELRVVFIGDGTPTVGPIRPADLSRAAAEAVPRSRGTVTTVAIGADADSESLEALARGGGGLMLPYVPGQNNGEAAYAVLGASYGMGLSDVRIELPDGLVEVAPKEIGTIGRGSEAIVVARMSRPQVTGSVVLRGKVGDEAFEQRYPLEVSASSDSAHAFVPRLYAAKRITDLEREGSAEARERAVALSSEYNVASRFTSLLVLESPAMFKAFGLDNSRRAPTWTGEEELAGAKAKGDFALAADDADPFGGDRLDAVEKRKEPASSSGAGFATGRGRSMGAPLDAVPALTAPPRAKPTSPRSEPEPLGNREIDARRRDRRLPMIPMRRIFERRISISTSQLVPSTAAADKVAAAEAELAKNDNRRAAVQQLYKLLALAGQLERASELAERWSAKEALDPEALTARADIAARRGRRDEAIRILGSVVDVRPGDVAAQKRLARLHRWAGRPALGCRHSIAISQMRPEDVELLVEAVRCGRASGEARLVDQMLLDSAERVRTQAEARLKADDTTADQLRGELRLEATWEGGADLDLALIHPAGHRVSWLGAPTRAIISATDVTSSTKEGLALLGSPAGEYVVEVVRASGEGPVRGTLTITGPGDTRSVPFVLEGQRASVATLRVRFESRLVPVSGWR